MWLFVFIAEAIYRDFRGEGVAQDHGRDASGSRVALAGDFLSSFDVQGSPHGFSVSVLMCDAVLAACFTPRSRGR